MIDDSPEFARLKDLVESSLVGLLPEVDGKSKTLFEAMRYTLRTPGKRIRPVLLLLACELAGGDAREAAPYACAVEFVHNYSLIHDDLPAMDDDDLRRGEPTNHKVYGEAMAILAGDGLLSAAFELIHKDYLLYLDDAAGLKRRIRAGAEIARGCGCRGMIAGQVADIEAENRAVSAEMLDYIHINKTASLIRAAILAGAYLGGAKPDMIENLSVFGENLGLSFQIADDILDVTGAAETLGKTPGKDERAHKATYPSLHGTEASYRRLGELTERAVHAIQRGGGDEGRVDLFISLARELARRTR
ncbi:MAG: polyprenyl synthetase family protein [Clostridiales Family XIII bacterium]|jgi:geranylgeranyl diphosphate synthase type II|nr:polyprenyl synthetase family protein [Clostridiales Family XIII bacterium]